MDILTSQYKLFPQIPGKSRSVPNTITSLGLLDGAFEPVSSVTGLLTSPSSATLGPTPESVSRLAVTDITAINRTKRTDE